MLLAAFLSISASLCLAANEPLNTQVTGMDWLQMSVRERMDYIQVSMLVLNKHGVSFGQSRHDYYNAAEQKLLHNHDLYDAKATHILSSIIYETEPENREALDGIRKKPQVQKI